MREWLKEIRTKKGLTQKEAAALLNIAQSYYNSKIYLTNYVLYVIIKIS